MLEKLQEVPNVVWLAATLVIGGAAIALLVTNRNQQVLSTVSLPIEVVEYFDYQCSHCQNLHPTMVQIEEEFGDKVVVIPKYLPIFYNSATNYTFAYGAEAARVQGGQEAFDKYISTLNAEVALVRSGQVTTTSVTPSFVASQAGLDMDKFNSDFVSSAVRQAVNAAKVEVALEYDSIFKLESGSLSYLFGYGAEAAREQGMFSEYHNAVFDALIGEDSSTGVVADPISIAESLGLDMVKFNADFIDRDIRERVIASRDEGVAKGISSTPTIFIEGQRTDNIGRNTNTGTDYTPLIEAVERYIQQGEANANQ